MKEYIENLIGIEWTKLLGFKFLIKMFAKTGFTIKSDRRSFTVYPEKAKDIFNIFRNLDPSDIKVVIVGQDPYHDGSYDGRAFSNATDTLKISPSLKNILKEIEDDIYNGLHLDYDPCLERLEKQGVFLMNKVLTVRAGKPGSHKGIGWEEFTDRVISRLSESNKNIVFLLWGADARKVMPRIIGQDHLILTSGHPSPLSANQGYWFGNKHFSETNAYLKKHNKKEIKW